MIRFSIYRKKGDEGSVNDSIENTHTGTPLKYEPLPRDSATQVRLLIYFAISYAAMLLFIKFKLPGVDENAKKVLSQISISTIYVATLSSGMSFVWPKKARKNSVIANLNKSKAIKTIETLEKYGKKQSLRNDFTINKANEIIEHADCQLKRIEELGFIYESTGKASMILVAVGTLLALLGSG